MAAPDDPRCGKIYQGFKLIKRLGRGGFGVVYEAVVVAESTISYSSGFKVNDRFAIKVISKSTLQGKKGYEDRMLCEIGIHLKLDHPSILKLHKHFKENGDYFLILDLCPNGDIKRVLKNRKEPFPEEFARDCLQQIVQGVKYLHERRILHRDLKPENLLFDDKMNIKICDFGMAVEMEDVDGEDKRCYTRCGTPGNLPPEMTNGKQYSFEVDVWTLGVILYYFVIGKSLDEFHVKEGTFSGVDKDSMLQFPSECELSSNVKDLLQRMLCKNQEKRIKPIEILRHPFMLDINLSKTGNSRMADSGISSLKTLSDSNTFSSRKLHSEEVARSKNATQNNRNMRARSEDIIGPKKHNSVPRFGKVQPDPNTNDYGYKARPIDALKEKIQVLPSLKTGFSDHSLNDGVDSQRSTVCRKETNEVLNSCHRHQQIDHCQQQNLLLSHAVRDCECNSRCGDVHNTKCCCGTSQHSSHGTGANGICNRPCQGCKKACCTEGEHCQLRNCRNEARTDISHYHRSVPSDPCTHSSRDNCGDNNCHQQSTTCSHFGHCLTSHCVHQKSCACKQEAYVNHESCTYDCQRKNKLCHTSNFKNPAVSNSYNVHGTAEPERDYLVRSQLPGTSKRPQILNTKHLKPRCNAYKFHRYSILDEGAVSVETFDKKEKKYVINVYIISSDGMEISFYKFRRRHKVKLKVMPPSIPENFGYPQTFAYEDMPSQHWGIYSRASTYVAYVKAITPRVLIYSSEAKAILFQSMVNYEVTFYSGDGHKGGKFVKRLEGMEFIDGVDKIPVVGLNAIHLSDNLRKMLTHALELERKCRLMSDFVESDCDAFFPVYIGSKPAKFCTSFKNNNNKENTMPTSAMHPTLSHFNGVSVNGTRSLRYPLMSLENRNVPLETLGTSSNILRQKTSRNGYDSPSDIIMRETKKGHFSLNVRDKTLSARFHDGSGYEHQLGSEFFLFCKQLGKKSRQYKFKSPSIPSHVAEKVKDVLDVMKEHFANIVE